MRSATLNPLDGNAMPIAAAVPSTFARLSAGLQQCLDRRLGYFGRNRFVYFYYEPRGQEVIWNDGQSYGFSCGGWMTYDEIAPLARNHGADLGDTDHHGQHVLLVDRTTAEAYFADRPLADRFIAEQSTAA